MSGLSKKQIFCNLNGFFLLCSEKNVHTEKRYFAFDVELFDDN